MVSIKFISADGIETVVEVAAGTTVMRAALENAVQGITAECNGSAACATCHAIFDDSRMDLFPGMEEHENDLLDFAASPRETGSRLSCQIVITEVMDGMEVRLPKAQ